MGALPGHELVPARPAPELTMATITDGLIRDGLTFDDAGFRQDAAIDQSCQHQTVSVTLLRWGGLSGS